MHPVDLSTHPRIGRYVDLLRRVSRHTEPAEVQREFANMVKFERSFDGMISISVRGLPRGQYKITRLNLDDDVGTVTMNPWERWESIPAHSGGFIGRVIESPEPKILQHMTVRDDPVLYAHASRTFHLESNPGNARALVQAHGEGLVALRQPESAWTEALRGLTLKLVNR